MDKVSEIHGYTTFNNNNNNNNNNYHLHPQPRLVIGYTIITQELLPFTPPTQIVHTQLHDHE